MAGWESSMLETTHQIPDSGSQIQCRATEGFSTWMAELPGTLALTTYQAGKVACIGWRGDRPSLLMRDFDKPMGLAVAAERLALATRNEVIFLANAPMLAP